MTPASPLLRRVQGILASSLGPRKTRQVLDEASARAGATSPLHVLRITPRGLFEVLPDGRKRPWP